MLRWLKDLAGALPEVSSIALEQINTPQGHAGLRNALELSQQLGRIDPDRLQAVPTAVETNARKPDQAGSATAAYNPPGVSGTLRLLRDEELWTTLSPLIAGIKAFSENRQASESPEH